MRMQPMSLGLAVAEMPLTVEAHGPARLRALVARPFAVSPDRVWDAISHFGQFDWHPRVASVAGGATGRTLTLETGGVMDEALIRSHAARRSLSWRISQPNLAVLPVTNCTMRLTVREGDDGARAVWSAAFYRACIEGDAPEGEDDVAAVAAVTAWIEAGLDGLDAMLGGR